MNDQASPTVTLFLVEDDEIDIRATKQSFKEAGITNPVITAEDGLDAFEMLKNGKVSFPCVILLDINMPRMDGFKFLELVRSHEAFRSIPIFALSTSRREEDIQKSYSFNVAGYLYKHNLGEDFDKHLRFLKMYLNSVIFPSPQ